MLNGHINERIYPPSSSYIHVYGICFKKDLITKYHVSLKFILNKMCPCVCFVSMCLFCVHMFVFVYVFVLCPCVCFVSIFFFGVRVFVNKAINKVKSIKVGETRHVLKVIAPP